MKNSTKKQHHQAAQRANQSEMQETLKVLKAFWEKAYNEGQLVFSFNPGEEFDADCIFNSLADYRKKINRRSLEYYLEFKQIQEVALKRPDKLTVVLERKADSMSRRSATIKKVAARVLEPAHTTKAVALYGDMDTGYHDRLAAIAALDVTKPQKGAKSA